MQLLVFFTGEVKQYPHRTARVGDAFYNCDQDSPELEWFEKELAKRAGEGRDNHTVYEITKDGKKVYVQFSDRKVMFGLSIVLGNY